MKEKVPNRNSLSSETCPPGFGLTITNAFNRTFDYVPVDEKWQRSICSAFGWPFVRPSRGESVVNAFGLHHKIRPRTNSIIGDGNCWYRAIAHIATGFEGNFDHVKNSLIDFMQANVDALQQVYNNNPHLIGNDGDYPFDNRNGDYAQRVINYHSEDRQWAKNVVMEITSVMLKTKFYKYDFSGGWSDIQSGHFPFWAYREFIAIYPDGIDISGIPDLCEQSMYIAHPNRTHFETCHTGLHGI